VHLVRVVKQTLRSIDVIARWGGEEFIIIMPETGLEEAAQAMVRVQRELTKHFFTADEQRLFITFSAGVALRMPHEAQETLIKRADKAMYEAKQSGKNRWSKQTDTDTHKRTKQKGRYIAAIFVFTIHSAEQATPVYYRCFAHSIKQSV
jgi:predicted signal transduction protein with EAL and GGDEF domain